MTQIEGWPYFPGTTRKEKICFAMELRDSSRKQKFFTEVRQERYSLKKEKHSFSFSKLKTKARLRAGYSADGEYCWHS